MRGGRRRPSDIYGHSREPVRERRTNETVSLVGGTRVLDLAAFCYTLLYQSGTGWIVVARYRQLLR